MEIVLSLGANINQERNISEAKNRLKLLFPHIAFTNEQWTEPVGVVSDKYLNCLATMNEAISLEQLTHQLKSIEHEMGDSHQNHQQGRVIIDIDIIRYGKQQIKRIVWMP